MLESSHLLSHSSRGLGRSPLKAKTGVRIPYGALKTTHSVIPHTSDYKIIFLLFVGLSTLYFATVSGITSSNDGSHYALTRTLVENHHFTLDQFDDYAEGNDIAIKDGRLYSDRPPGTAFVTTPFYWIGSFLPAPLSPLPSRHDAGNPRLLYVMLLPVWAGAGTAVFLYLLLRHYHLSTQAALTAVLFFALGTAHWKYSTVLFSHALSSFLVTLSLFLILYIFTSHVSRFTFHTSRFTLGFLLGLAVVVEYSNALLAVLAVGYVVWQIRPFSIRAIFQSLFPIAIGATPPALFLAYYNSVNFGSPFTLSYAYAVNYEWAARFSTTFNYPLLAGLKALVWWGEGGGWCGGPPCLNQGIFLLSPILLLTLPGLYFALRSSLLRPHRLFVLAIFTIYLLLFAKHQTSHGFTADGRYLVPFLGLLSVPLAFCLEQSLFHFSKSAGQPLWNLLIYGLFFLSVHNILWHIGFSYNYTLDLTQFSNLAASPANWAYFFQHIFPNAANLPLLWLLEGAGLLLVVLGRYAKMPR